MPSKFGQPKAAKAAKPAKAAKAAIQPKKISKAARCRKNRELAADCKSCSAAFPNIIVPDQLEEHGGKWFLDEKIRRQVKSDLVENRRIWVPRTDGEKTNRDPEPVYVKAGTATIVTDFQKTERMRYIPQLITNEENQILVESTREFLGFVKPNADLTSRGSGKSISIQLGWMRDSAGGPYLTTTTLDNYAEFGHWRQTNYSVFQKIEAAFEFFLPELHQFYYDETVRIGLQGRFFGAFCTLTLNANIDGGSKPHTDYNDVSCGYSWVLPFGNFTGGEFNMAVGNQFIEVAAQAGDALYFQSHEFEHWNSTIVGERYSLVFFMHGTMFFMPLDETERQFYKSRNEARKLL